MPHFLRILLIATKPKLMWWLNNAISVSHFSLNAAISVSHFFLGGNCSVKSIWSPMQTSEYRKIITCINSSSHAKLPNYFKAFLSHWSFILPELYSSHSLWNYVVYFFSIIDLSTLSAGRQPMTSRWWTWWMMEAPPWRTVLGPWLTWSWPYAAASWKTTSWWYDQLSLSLFLFVSLSLPSLSVSCSASPLVGWLNDTITDLKRSRVYNCTQCIWFITLTIPLLSESLIMCGWT